MKDIEQIVEGILDGLDMDVEVGAFEAQALKLADKWHNSMADYKASKGTDTLGNKLAIGDWVLCFGSINPVIGKIIHTDWGQSGSNMTVITGDPNNLNRYKNFRGELCCNERADQT